MKHLFASFLLHGAILFAAPAYAQCEAPVPAGANRIIDLQNPDVVLFSETMRYYVNYERCIRGLPLFLRDPQLFNAALNHSRYMAQVNIMSHESTIRGMRTLRDRLKAWQVPMQTAGENIAQNYAYVLANHSRNLKTRGPCQYTYSDTGLPVPPHSYGSLAFEQLAGWMISPHHYQNIINPRFVRMETGMAYAPDPQTCGRIYLAQDFAG